MADAMWERSIRFAFWNLNDREGFGHEKKKKYLRKTYARIFSRLSPLEFFDRLDYTYEIGNIFINIW